MMARIPASLKLGQLGLLHQILQIKPLHLLAHLNQVIRLQPRDNPQAKARVKKTKAMWSRLRLSKLI
jgi:hypothetical protein